MNGSPGRRSGPALLVTAAIIVGSPAPALSAPDSQSPNAPVAGYVPPTGKDFSQLPWSTAFRRLHHKMHREYAFGDWKDIPWRALRRKYTPRFEKAEAARDRQAYYLALREYSHEFQDGHVSIKGDFPAVTRRLAGGGFGLTVMQLDDGRVIADWVQRGGPAWRAGVRPRARITRWRGRGIVAALRRTSTALSPAQPTDYRVRYEQLRFLVRARIGADRTLAFRITGDERTRTVRLVAVDDDELTLGRTSMVSILNTQPWPRRMVQSRMLSGGVGYIRINAEIDMPAEVAGDHTPTITLFRGALRELKADGAQGLIIDLRRNSGGSDQMVADFLSSFYGQRSFYEYQNYIDPSTGTFSIWRSDDRTGEFMDPGKGIPIKPGTPRYRGPVVALVDNGCISSGEGVAMGIKRLPHGRVVGFAGTNGSFGMAGDAAAMPGGFQVDWPYGQSLDKRKTVQVDSRGGRGGVTPDVPIPMTMRNAIRSANGHDVVLHESLAVLRVIGVRGTG